MARAFHITQASQSLPGRGDGMRAESPREVPVAEVIGVWLAAALTGWVLVGLVLAGIWRVVT
jgi:hypothetical protein